MRLKHSQIDFSRAEVVKGNERIPLTAKEHDLLSVLYRNAGRIVTIDALCEAAWGDNPFGYENSLMAHIRRIREKIELNPSNMLREKRNEVTLWRRKNYKKRAWQR